MAAEVCWFCAVCLSRQAEQATEIERKRMQRAVLAKFMTKFFFRILAENAFQLHVQITTVALSVALMGWTDGAEAVLYSIALSTVMLLYKLGQTLADVQTIWNVVDDSVLRAGIASGVVLALLVVSYALAKIWALFQCPDHVLNLSGCVKLDL
mmetsp:Transcript_15158/g.33808  ORF Transcript_15158/g.33808 Transcript_15158/m.33808 type:complete len:153 (-) Transcript_15158:46-504(-)